MRCSSARTPQLSTRSLKKEIDEIAAHVEAASLLTDEHRRENGKYEIEDIEFYKKGYEGALKVLKPAVAVGDIEPVREAVNQFLDIFHYNYDLQDNDFKKLALAYMRASISANQKLLQRYEGEDVPTPEFAYVEHHRLSTVIQDYRKNYQSAKRAAMAKKIGAVLDLFLEVVGDKYIHALRQTDINEFFEIVNKLPPRWSDVKRQLGISARQVAEMNLGTMAKATFDGTYKAVMKPFLETCQTNWQDRGFPTSLTTNRIEYRGEREKRTNNQRAFTPEELTVLFCGPEMRAFAEDASQHHKYWLPHLGLFTGARVNELCQINPQCDIVKDEKYDIWYLNISEDSEGYETIDKSVKTDSSKRIVPIHSKLIDLGFLNYAENLKEKKIRLLFPGFPPQKRRAAATAEKWFRQHLKDVNLRDETPGKRIVGMHAFRSTFLRQADRLGVANATAITGHTDHSKSSVVKGYEGEKDIDLKKKIIEQITFDPVVFIQPASPQSDS